MIVIGRFKETHNDEAYPSIFTAIRKEAHKNKEMILDYMKHGKISAVAPGYLQDVIDNNTRINNLTCYTDGTYTWRSDVIYYFDKYNIALPNDFIDHVLRAIRSSRE